MTSNDSCRHSDIISQAIMYTQAFFLKRCYFNYEKEIIGCAALYLASKNEYSKIKLSDLLLIYHKTKLQGKWYFLSEGLKLRDNYSSPCLTNKKTSWSMSYACSSA